MEKSMNENMMDIMTEYTKDQNTAKKYRLHDDF
jgi:hypothetical protein